MHRDPSPYLSKSVEDTQSAQTITTVAGKQAAYGDNVYLDADCPNASPVIPN